MGIELSPDVSAKAIPYADEAIKGHDTGVSWVGAGERVRQRGTVARLGAGVMG